MISALEKYGLLEHGEHVDISEICNAEKVSVNDAPKAINTNL